MKNKNEEEIIASLIKALEGESREAEEDPKLLQEEQEAMEKERQEELEDIISYVSNAKPRSYTPDDDEVYSIQNKIDNQHKALENRDLEQNINLKRKTLWILLSFLGTETVFIFFYAWCQATEWWGFNLEEWSFRLLVGATITQITTMLLIAVKHLFPNHH
ncbi:MAG: hypothetical protein PHI66_04705 [Candidatus Pacebacteria bacterium]|nr:hypothetical protein [Candidatus Paceibacterota bacterium]